MRTWLRSRCRRIPALFQTPAHAGLRLFADGLCHAVQPIAPAKRPTAQGRRTTRASARRQTRWRAGLHIESRVDRYAPSAGPTLPFARSLAADLTHAPTRR